jgi:uncharacterized membrane protein
LRVDDYRFYGQLCKIFGVALLVVGILLPIFTTTWYTFLGRTYYDSPYLGHGIALAAIGIVLIVLNLILVREYRFRTTKTQGEPVAPSVGYCPYCGAVREEGGTYCRKCGKKLP